jgi:hypothetical protein
MSKGNVRAGPGSGWTAAALNHILQAHVVDGTLTTFGCVEWESEQFVGCNACQMLPVQAAKAALSWCEPIGIHISIYQFIPVCTCTYHQYVPVYTSTYHYLNVLVHSSTSIRSEVSFQSTHVQ